MRNIWKIKNIDSTVGAQLRNIKQKVEVLEKKRKLRHETEKVFINNYTTGLERQSKKEF